MLPSLRQLSTLGCATDRSLFQVARREADRVDFDGKRIRARAGHLSGGNQQKLVLGKLLLRGPQVLLIDEPVKGIDIGAKAEIFTMLRGLARAGLAIVMASEETEELLAVADRVAVVAGGQIVDEVPGCADQLERVLTAVFPTAA